MRGLQGYKPLDARSTAWITVVEARGTVGREHAEATANFVRHLRTCET
jgi:hypothetical protein